MRHWKLRRHLSGLLAVVVVLVGLGYTVAGHPIALASSGAAALILVAPELNAVCCDFFVRRAPGSMWVRTLFYIGMLAVGAGLTAGYPLAVHNHAMDARTGAPLRDNPTFILMTIVGGPGLFGITVYAWVHDVRRTWAKCRSEKETDALKASRR